MPLIQECNRREKLANPCLNGSDSRTSSVGFSHWIGPVLSVAFFCIAAWIVRKALRRESYQEIHAALKEIPTAAIVLTALLTAAGYCVQPMYDLLGLRFIHRKLRFTQIFSTSFVGYALGNNFGTTLVAGGSVRLWLYGALGIPAGDVARLTIFCTLSFVLGCIWVAALTFIAEPIILPVGLGFPSATSRPIGFTLLAFLVIYLAFVAKRHPAVAVWRWSFELPRLPLTAAQIGVATLDLLAMSGALWILLPPISYWQFLPIFMLALISGVVSQVPGGLGVFESIILTFLRDKGAPDETFAALIAFRFIY